jgi:putative Mg2+ transporter-C (MgtC) family protein
VTNDAILVTITIRLGLSFLAAFALGWNREELGHPAGLRTLVLISISACTAMLFADWLLVQTTDTGNSLTKLDLMRLAQGVLGGIGFIGAGTILKQGNIVRGVTTAATLWLSTVIGLCFGGGAWELGLAATLVGLVTLQALGRIESIIHRRHYGIVTIAFGPDLEHGHLLDTLGELEFRVQSRMLKAGADQSSLRCVGSYRHADPDWPIRLLARINATDDVTEVAWEDLS